MKNDQDYLKDLSEIRSMMERSSKFLSLSGFAGVMAGIYALLGAWVAYQYLAFHPQMMYSAEDFTANVKDLVLLGAVILILALGTAILLSKRKASQKGETVWNSTSKRMITSMAVPLFTGGILILILLARGLIGIVAPLTLIFYGLALYNASKFTYEDVKYLGVIQVVLGLISCWYIGYGLFFWAIGFGVIHIVYGLYMHVKYER